MSNWSDLPNEVLSQIVNTLGDDHSKNGWMFANKRLFNLYQSIIYKDISIRLDLSDNNLNSILHSASEPGEYVKSIVFTSMTAPTSLDDLNFEDDLLSRLMINAPHVEDIQFSPAAQMSAKEWAYFTMVLINNRSWSLRSLPIASSNKLLYSSFYFNCALHSRNSLVRLDLAQGVIGRNYNYLDGFKKLTTLDADKNVLKNMYDLDLMLQYLPHLAQVSVRFTNNNNNTTAGDKRKFLPNSYSNIKKMTLIGYTPSSDEGLIIFMKKFRGLNNLCIIGQTNMPWPAKAISFSVAKLFFKYIHEEIPNYQITAGFNNIQSVQFINGYYPIDEHDKFSIFSIEFKKDDNDIANLAENESFITTKKFDVAPCRTIEYCLVGDTEMQQLVAKQIIAHISTSVIHAKIGGDRWKFTNKGMESAGICLSALIGAANHLCGIMISGTVMNSYRPPDISTGPINLTWLLFQLVFFENDDILPLLSESIQGIEDLRFSTCLLPCGRSSLENINISMPNTAVNTLYITEHQEVEQASSIDKTSHSIMLISVVSVDQNVSSYYVCDSNDETSKLEISKDTFFSLSVELYFQKESRAVIVYVEFKSIKTLILRGVFDTHYNIQITFP